MEKIEKSFPAAKLLHSFGAAIHLVKPMSKAPVHKRWSRREKDSWESLNEQFKPKFNLGIRPGGVSTFDDGTHLVVLDIDVKSTDPKHFREAIEKAKSVFPEIENAPFSLTGRGNGSRHYFLRTIQKARIERIFQSDDKCVVDVGGQQVYRPSWEIMLLGEGSQALLPGSVHPDTKRQYQWGKAPERLEDLPVMTYQQSPEPEINESSMPVVKKRYKIKDGVSVWDFGFSADDIEAIENGTNVLDRSAEIFRLMKFALDRGADEDDLLTLFSDPSLYLGKTPYDEKHTGSRKRGVAMRWLDRFCLVPAKRESILTTPGFDFDLNAKVSVVPKAKKSKKQKDQAGLKRFTGKEWEESLEIGMSRDGFKLYWKPNFHNVRLILTEVNGRAPFISTDLFSGKVTFTRDMPWGITAGTLRSDKNQDALKIKDWLLTAYGIDAKTTIIDEILDLLALLNSFHPVRDFLNSLQWDGVSRVRCLFSNYLGCNMDWEYQSEAAMLFMQGLIRRVFEPGCFFRHVIVLEGPQYLGKSTFARELVGAHWFLDNLPNVQDKDAALYLFGIWLCEIAELSAVHRSSIEAVKAFISRRDDKFRLPYARMRTDNPRSTVFIGTTNDFQYLQDPTGNSRFVPIQCVALDEKALIRDREQLFAEAMYLYKSGQFKRLSDDFLERAQIVQDSRTVEDESDLMITAITNWFNNNPTKRTSKISMEEVMNIPLATFPKGPNSIKKAAIAMKRLGFVNCRDKIHRFWALENPE